MQEHTLPNIVNMTDFKMNTNGENKASLQLLNECRDVMADRLSQAVSAMLNKADDILFDLAQKSGSQEHRYYFNAMREVRLKRMSIEGGFRENFANHFNHDILTGAMNDDARSRNQGYDKINIDIEEAIAISASADKIRHDSHAALFSLDHRMHELLKPLNPEQRQNPIRPETVCLAFQESCQTIDSGIEIKLILFKLFEKYVTAGLNAACADIDTLLTEKKVSPQAKPAVSAYTTPEPGEDAAGQAQNHPGISKDKNYFIVASRIIRNEITQHIGTATLPDFIGDFIFTHWSKLLLKIHIKEGTGSKAWLHAIDVIDDLVKCTGNETSLAEKQELASLMPNLIQRLKYGMNVIPVTSAIREEFITELNEYQKELLAAPEEKKLVVSQSGSEDITIPKFRNGGESASPFSSELLVDNRKGIKTIFKPE